MGAVPEIQLGYDIGQYEPLIRQKVVIDGMLGVEMNERMLTSSFASALSPAKLKKALYMHPDEIMLGRENDQGGKDTMQEKRYLGIFFESIFRYFDGESDNDLLQFLNRKTGDFVKYMKNTRPYYNWRDQERQKGENEVAAWLGTLDMGIENDKEMIFWMAHKACMAREVFANRFECRKRGRNDALLGSFLHPFSRGEKTGQNLPVVFGADYLSYASILETKLSLASALDGALIQLSMAQLVLLANHAPIRRKSDVFDLTRPVMHTDAEHNFTKRSMYVYSYAEGKLGHLQYSNLGQFCEMLQDYVFFATHYRFYRETLAKHRRSGGNRYLIGLSDQIKQSQESLAIYQESAKAFLASCQVYFEEMGDLYEKKTKMIGKTVEQMRALDLSVEERLKLKVKH